MGRTYCKELLEEYEAKNIEYNGKKLTEYEALQEQRKTGTADQALETRTERITGGWTGYQRSHSKGSGMERKA